MPPIVAMLTDFGERDTYAGVMKGVMLGLHPEVRIVDLCHQVEPFDIAQAAYLLYTAWDHFPPGTVFLAVVDPGVGSSRRSLAAEAGSRLLISPDNGTVSLVLRLHPELRCYRLRDVGRDPAAPASSTFHGRDIFAPAAARAAVSGIEAVRGEQIQPVTLDGLRPRAEAGGRLRARIVHIDRFGNCISAAHRGDLEKLGPPADLRVRFGRRLLRGLRDHYAEVPPGTALAYLGSSGFLEIAVREGSAARRLHLRTGDEIEVEAGPSMPRAGRG